MGASQGEGPTELAQWFAVNFSGTASGRHTARSHSHGILLLLMFIRCEIRCVCVRFELSFSCSLGKAWVHISVGSVLVATLLSNFRFRLVQVGKCSCVISNLEFVHF